eukprot:TRINITY_DN50749_c0_g1_i1.p1 TRINITY_DN50749_c0_g1~~TRINITY_DN50749_c0_g1_i1.p1  ORF type:complete len:286 (+),score=46.43 TRINITY_DN50749_c0_g1_i1:83-859(+)
MAAERRDLGRPPRPGTRAGRPAGLRRSLSASPTPQSSSEAEAELEARYRRVRDARLQGVSPSHSSAGGADLSGWGPAVCSFEWAATGGTSASSRRPEPALGYPRSRLSARSSSTATPELRGEAAELIRDWARAGEVRRPGGCSPNFNVERHLWKSCGASGSLMNHTAVAWASSCRAEVRQRCPPPPGRPAWDARLRRGCGWDADPDRGLLAQETRARQLRRREASVRHSGDPRPWPSPPRDLSLLAGDFVGRLSPPAP